jgi:polysaccharide biosynthesis protein PslG
LGVRALILALSIATVALSAQSPAPSTVAPLRRGDLFGAVTHYWGDVIPVRMRELGANWARVHCSWAEVQPTPSADPTTWNWGCADQAMAAASQGFHVLYGLGYAPSWANGGRSGVYPPTPDHLGDWYHYCAELMRRYAGRGIVYEVWNEPNLDSFFAGTFDDYANLVRYASQAVRAVDPTARLSGPETSSSSTPGRQSWYHDAVTQFGGMLDVVTVHWYCGNPCGPTADAIGQQVAAYIQARAADLPEGVPLWLSETGIGTEDDAVQARFFDGVLLAYEQNFTTSRRRRPAWQNVFFYHLLAPDNETMVWLDGSRTPRLAFLHYREYILGRPFAVPRR